MENIRCGRLAATDDEVVAADKIASADQFIRRLPQRYATPLSERGSNLSQGQRPLLSIARAILADPGILILDEATSSIDTRTERTIQEAMLRLVEGRTSFVIAPYAEMLLSAVPKTSHRGIQRTVTRGEPPNLLELPPGCVFQPRCRYAQPHCKDEPPELREVGTDHYVRCHLAEELTLRGVM